MDSFQQFRNKAKEKADRLKMLEQQEQKQRSHKEAAEKRQQEQQKKREEMYVFRLLFEFQIGWRSDIFERVVRDAYGNLEVLEGTEGPCSICKVPQRTSSYLGELPSTSKYNEVLHSASK